jgi:hypothetical protein
MRILWQFHALHWQFHAQPWETKPNKLTMQILGPLVVLAKFDVPSQLFATHSMREISLNWSNHQNHGFFSPQFCDSAKLLIISPKKILKPIFGYRPDMKVLAKSKSPFIFWWPAWTPDIW